MPIIDPNEDYLIACGNNYFVFPNNYNQYVNRFNNTFQHGGISMNEWIVPVATLNPKYMLSIDKVTCSAEETMLLAESLSINFLPGGIYGFTGDLASGKTTFIKGLLMGMGYKQMVNSPTFTLINEYPIIFPTQILINAFFIGFLFILVYVFIKSLLSFSQSFLCKFLCL